MTEKEGISLFKDTCVTCNHTYVYTLIVMPGTWYFPVCIDVRVDIKIYVSLIFTVHA